MTSTTGPGKRRGLAALLAPVLAFTVVAVAGAGGSVAPAANTDVPMPEAVRVESFVSANQSRCVAAPGAAQGDVAVVNITNTQAEGRGWGALRPFGATPVFNRPSSSQYSSVNFAAQTPPNPNLAVTEVGVDGEFCYDGAIVSHHVLLDVSAVIPAANVSNDDRSNTPKPTSMRRATAGSTTVSTAGERSKRKQVRRKSTRVTRSKRTRSTSSGIRTGRSSTRSTLAHCGSGRSLRS